MSQICRFCSNTIPTPNPGQNSSLTSSSHVIERYALNGKGAVGSLYDARTDTLLCDFAVKEDAIQKENLFRYDSCRLIKADGLLRTNLLEMIGIEVELRLSIILGMTPDIKGTLLLSSYALSNDHRVRLIVYRRVDQGEFLSVDIWGQNNRPCVLPNARATHIVTSVHRGIDFVLAVRLPCSESYDKIDPILSQLSEYFTQCQGVFLSNEDQKEVKHLHATIYTQNDELRSQGNTGSFSDICQAIHRFIFHRSHDLPLSLVLHDVNCLYREDSSKENIFCKLDSWTSHIIEQTIVPLNNKVRYIEHLALTAMSSELSLSLPVPLEAILKRLHQVRDMYTNIQQLVAAKVSDLRQGKYLGSLVVDVVSDQKFSSLEVELRILEAATLRHLSKHSFITKLRANNCREYINIADLEQPNDDLSTLKRKLILSLNHKENKYFLCSSDECQEKYPDEYCKQFQLFFNEYQKNSSVCLVFADFSYCVWKLEITEILPPSTLPSTVVPKEINVLLIGETGVGKSTFINAFVNYLAFQSIEDAKTSEPIVLIPASFLITVGDDFEEKHIEFGQRDSNECHNNLGHSVTQHCKSYIFSIGNHVKVRLIDTPGLGDTRGLEQDDKNIEHILSYTNQFSHLNAICFLLKPNTTRLHASFRLCFTQLLHFLGPIARDNVIFCFTNTRSTFYTPGDTAPILRKMLNELPNDYAVSFVRENTFCFDSEAFQYLAIIRTGHELEIDSYQKQDYEKSWQNSSDESIRLLTYLRHRPKYQMNRCHSIKHTQMTITLLVRPIVEALRYIARNLVWREVTTNPLIIDMQAISEAQPASFCMNCPWQMAQIDDIWIVSNQIHKQRSFGECSTCSCSSAQHLSILYTLDYKLGMSTTSDSELESMRDQLLQKSLLLTQFLFYTSSTFENPFIGWFDWFIKQEEELFSKVSTNQFNSKLCLSLHDIRDKYLNALQYMTFEEKEDKLDAIYNYTDELMKFPVILKQMDAVRESQMQTLKDNECDVHQKNPDVNMHGLLDRL